MMNVLRWLQLFLVVILTLGLISACSNSSIQADYSSEAISDCHIIYHALGETCVPNQPQRVIALGVPTLGDAIALGVKPIASIFYFDDPPPYLAKYLESIELLGKNEQPNLEKILTLKPDLIIGFSYSIEAIYRQISQIAPTVIDDWQGFPSWKDHFNFVAKALGKTEEAKDVWAHYNRHLQELKEALDDHYKGIEISVIRICCNNLASDVKNSFSGIILDDVGLRRPPPQDAVEGGLAFFSEELIADMDGDTMFVMVGDDDESKQVFEQLQKNPLWSQLKAVQQGQVYPVNLATWRGGNPLAADAVIDDLFRYLVNHAPDA